MDFFEVIYNPDGFFKKLKEKGLSFKIPLTIIGIAIVVSIAISYSTAGTYARAIVDALSQTTSISEEETETIYAMIYYSTLITSAIMTLISWIVISVVFQVISYFFDGKGNFTTTLKFTSFGYVPTIVLSPVNYIISLETARILSVSGIEGLKSGMGFESTIISILILIWQITIWTFAVKHARGISNTKALITTIIPGGILIIASLISIMFSTTFTRA